MPSSEAAVGDEARAASSAEEAPETAVEDEARAASSAEEAAVVFKAGRASSAQEAFPSPPTGTRPWLSPARARSLRARPAT